MSHRSVIKYILHEYEEGMDAEIFEYTKKMLPMRDVSSFHGICHPKVICQSKVEKIDLVLDGDHGKATFQCGSKLIISTAIKSFDIKILVIEVSVRRIVQKLSRN